MAAAPDFDQITDEVATQLLTRFPDADRALVRTIAADEVQRLSTIPVTNYIGVLAGRAAKQRLRAAVPERRVA